MEWLVVPADAYLDHRHRNWILAEEMADVRFDADRGVVFVHRVRAEHIARALLGDSDVLLEDARPLSASSGAMARRVPPPQPQPLIIERSRRRWRDLWGWLGIVAGAAVFVAALAVPLDDPALVVALAVGLRGGRLVLDVDS